MDTDKRRRLFQEYGYRREKEIISRIWIQTGEGDYIKNRDTTVDGNYIKNMDTDERWRLYQEYGYRLEMDTIN